MMYSIIIPVYNRPDELDELLVSLTLQTYNQTFEVVIVEDGSSVSSEAIIKKYTKGLDIKYFFKENTGPGDSRNYGMERASGDYFIIFDSDCIIPVDYLIKVDAYLQSKFVDCFGGPDRAHDSFTDIQKAIDYNMTSILTTGGIRGKKSKKFQPRSFNLGLSKIAFEATQGFGVIHPGEDPELVFRLWKLGFETQLFEEAFVYHKRRIDIKKFYMQVNKFGKVRPIIESWHPEFAKVTFLFPTLFIIGLDISILLAILGLSQMLIAYACYFMLLFVHSLYVCKDVKVSFLAVCAAGVQFYGYGIGYLVSVIKIKILKKKAELEFPELFF